MMGFNSYLVEGGLQFEFVLRFSSRREHKCMFTIDSHMFKMVFVRYLTVIWSISFLVFLFKRSGGGAWNIRLLGNVRAFMQAPIL
jgi:hypothetical protein